MVKSMRWNKSTRGLICLILASAGLCSASTPLFHKKKYIMGTVFEIVAYGEPLATAQAVDEAFKEIARLDDVMSDYKADSALSRLNQSAHFQAQTVPHDLYRVIAESEKYSRLSDGKFDITVGPLAALWKAVIRGEPLPSAAEQEKLRACVDYRNIELLPPDQIEFHSPCLQVDLGAIGKGYALDRAVEVLRASGVSNALLNAGGSSFYAMGRPSGQNGWVLNLSDPSKKWNPQVTLTDESVSTSEQTPRNVLLKNSPGHIIDPEKGVPVRSSLAVSVVAKTATASDALSTTLLLVGPEAGKNLVEKVADIAAVWISVDGEKKTVSSGPQITLLGKGQSPPQ